MNPEPAPEPSVILFDGVCNLCDRSVRLIFRNDPAGRFRFAALQSEAGAALVARHGIAPELYSIVLIEDGRAYDRSTAALRIARRLRFPFPLLWAGMVLPRALRDLVYDAIARNRYRIWGTHEYCDLPPAGLRERFVGFE